MAEQKQGTMVPTLGLTGVTVNAMALIAPGAFLWLTFQLQAAQTVPGGIASNFSGTPVTSVVMSSSTSARSRCR